MENNMRRKMKTMDGNTAAAYVAYAMTEIAAIYPITPSSPMAESVDEWSAYGQTNIFGEPVRVVEMQSEAGAAGTVHGSLQAGALTTTFTASQGLLLMIPNMYKIAAELLPSVFHVSARSLSTHALSIFGDHSDVYAARQTGFAMLASGSVQEVMDMACIAHLSTIKGKIPFLHFFDGFRTSHEIQKIEEISYDVMAGLIDYTKIDEFRKSSLNPEAPVTKGTAQNPDIYFQGREALNSFYNAIPDIVESYMQEIKKITGREYHPFTYYGASDAEHVIVAMGSVTETIKETIDYLVEKGEKVGVITCHLYRPFSSAYFFKVLPETVKKIAVLDRTKEPGATGEPLCLDVKSLFYGRKACPVIVGGRYGLSSKDTIPAHVIAVYENLKLENPKEDFTVGITDDVTNTSLPLSISEYRDPEGIFQAKFYGLGSDGTVGANKNSIKIIGDNTDQYAQAYFEYDSKKSGGITISHLRFGKNPIRSTYFVSNPDFVACHVESYLEKYEVLKGIKKGGTFLLNSMYDENEIESKLPDKVKKTLAEKEVRFFIINATNLAVEAGMPGRTNSIMQAAFFKIADIIPYADAEIEMKEAIKKTYGKKGADVINTNMKAIDLGAANVIEIRIDKNWKDIVVKNTTGEEKLPEFVRDIAIPMNRMEGNDLPVSLFFNRPGGVFPQGTSAYEKRGIAVNVPEWIPENCIQCNQCSLSCPHAVIRPFLLDSAEIASLPAGITTVKAKGKEFDGLSYRLQVSPLDCQGCGVCANICPAKEKALVMKPLHTQMKESANWDYISENIKYKDNLADKYSVRGSQYCQPLFEFSGACAGCGETPYIKTLTQLFGDRMVIANATGCSSIYGGTAASSPYTVNNAGRGPAWASSLFEDNAEYGYGIQLGYSRIRERAILLLQAYSKKVSSKGTSSLIVQWLLEKDNPEASGKLFYKMMQILETDSSPDAKEILKYRDFLRKRSVWAIGGDGWAYDIGYGGLDHVIAANEKLNLLVLDTEVYSNTGGQSSKSTPTAAIAKFAASGKRTRKKDLGMMAISYGYVYVAQVAMGANQSQFLKAVKEAEEYPGPSLLIAYSPCISHGIRSGMNSSQAVMKNAVQSGYWHLYRYNPALEAEGKNPFTLDSKEPEWDKFRGFLMNETRYTSLKNEFPEMAEDMFKKAEEDAKRRYNSYKRMASDIG